MLPRRGRRVPMPPPQIVMRRSGGGVLRSSRGLQRTMQRGAFARCEASRRKRLLPLFAAEYCREAVGWIIISIWWKCPRDKVECDNKADLTIAGWVIFGILMASHLLRDLVNGSKMIVLCAEHGYSLPSRLRFFLGGLFLNTVTAFTLFSSTIYNKAIATSY
mmetsp:Transcript_28723/g.59660  ORF Transcript_28723/g.59660 Transcript_28723/m.59660 type:complete len:162 (-) Transcript_28723:143-628(-)